MNGRTGPVTATDADICQRLKDLRCYTIDGAAFYRLRDVFDALGMSRDANLRHGASALIDAGDKRYAWTLRETKSGKNCYDRRYCYINRHGVERLVLRYGGRIPRHRLMEALPLPTAVACSNVM